MINNLSECFYICAYETLGKITFLQIFNVEYSAHPLTGFPDKNVVLSKTFQFHSSKLKGNFEVTFPRSVCTYGIHTHDEVELLKLRTVNHRVKTNLKGFTETAYDLMADDILLKRKEN